MKQLYIIGILFFFSIITINAQTITVSQVCFITANGVYKKGADLNGKPTFSKDGAYFIEWAGSRWVLSFHTYQLGVCYLDTPLPPTSPWLDTSPYCSTSYLYMSGDGTYSANLSNSEITSSNQKISLLSNISTDFITISGLKQSEKYKILNALGAVMSQGTISNDNNKINILDLTSGLYFLHLKPGQVLKFIKK